MTPATKYRRRDYLANYKNAPGNGNPVHRFMLSADVRLRDRCRRQRGPRIQRLAQLPRYWRQTTYGNRQVVAGTWPVQSTVAPYYGYGSALATKNIKLWYEQESGRPQPVQFASGNYDCRC